MFCFIKMNDEASKLPGQHCGFITKWILWLSSALLPEVAFKKIRIRD